MLCLPKASKEVTLLTTDNISLPPLLATQFPLHYIHFNPETHETKSVTWNTASLSFIHQPTSTLYQITPHPIFTRLHLNIPYPVDTTNIKSIQKNQWWNVNWVKKWGKQQYTKGVPSALQAINSSWQSESPSFKSACRDIKPKSVWAPSKGTPSMQFLQYRITIHRLVGQKSGIKYTLAILYTQW